MHFALLKETLFHDKCAFDIAKNLFSYAQTPLLVPDIVC